MNEHSIEINIRLAEIKEIAASLPQGGHTAKLKVELIRLANWANQTLLYLSKIETHCICSDCDCQR